MQVVMDGIPLESLFLHLKEKFTGHHSAAEINHRNSEVSMKNGLS